MKNIQVLVANIDSTRNEEHAFLIIKKLRVYKAGVIYIDFWNMPSYLIEAITNGDMDIIVLSSLSESNKSMYPEIEEHLKDINKHNIPVINIVADVSLEKISETKSSIINVATNNIIERIQSLVDRKETLHKKPRRIAHIGIAVRNIKEALPFYIKSLGLELEAMEIVETEGVKVAFLKIGESRIELLEPLSPTSPVHRFIEKRGEGIHHIALEVDNIQARLNQLKINGIKLINEESTYGANQSQIAFIHPKSTNGVLFELCQYKVERKS